MNTIFSVTDISTKIKSLLEMNFSQIQVSGEISGLKTTTSKHTYFNLKDEQNLIFCTIWNFQKSLINIELADGQKVIITGKLTTFGGASRYQINVTNVIYEGIGDLLKKFEELKIKLKHLFNQKRPLPKYPKAIGVVTSATGAVIKDILHRIEERYPIPVILAPCAVQGKTAATEIRAALKSLQSQPVDLIIIARGGGSIEDLWCFNDEALIHDIFNSKIPTISAVGHEVDFTLCDFVADLRAPTPTAAAEIATPNKIDILKSISSAKYKILNTFDLKFSAIKKNLELFENKIKYNSPYIQLIQKLELFKEKFNAVSIKDKIQNLQRQFIFRSTLIFNLFSQISQNKYHKILKKYEEQYYKIKNFLEQPKGSILDFITKNKISYITDVNNQKISSIHSAPNEMYINFIDGTLKVKKNDNKP